MRPSGKMISALPAFTASISVRTANGRIGSSGSASVSLRNGLTHHIRAMPTSMANTGLRLRNDIARPASRKLTWLSAMMTFGPALCRFSSPCTSMRNSAR